MRVFTGQFEWAIVEESLRTIVTVMGFLCLACQPTLGSESRPNVVIILADDLGYGDVGCYGANDIRTPNLDGLAREGLKLKSFYAQPICGVSRAALMTGCYPIRVAEPGNLKNGHTILHPREVTLAEVLKDAGYRTGIVGKWHLGMSNGSRPYEQGFDHCYFTPAYNGATRNIQPGVVVPILRENGETVRQIKTLKDMETLTSDSTREALEFLRASREKPFFLYLAYHMPHVPLGASEKFRGKSARGLFGDVVEELDAGVGEVLGELKKLGLDEKTLVIFTSDNGPWRDRVIGDHAGSAGSLRGAKMATWEGGWRVPCLIRWPGRVPAGAETNQMASTMDLLPTLSAFARATLPKVRLDGMNLSAFITNKDGQSPRNTFLYHNGARLTAVRHKEWKLVFARPEGGEMPWQPPFVTSHIEALEKDQLFNLEKDLGETTDVSAAHPAEMDQLKQLARQAREELGDFKGPGTGNRFYADGAKWPANSPNRNRNKN
mgnify:FL=1